MAPKMSVIAPNKRIAKQQSDYVTVSGQNEYLAIEAQRIQFALQEAEIVFSLDQINQIKEKNILGVSNVFTYLYQVNPEHITEKLFQDLIRYQDYAFDLAMALVPFTYKRYQALALRITNDYFALIMKHIKNVAIVKEAFASLYAIFYDRPDKEYVQACAAFFKILAATDSQDTAFKEQVNKFLEASRQGNMDYFMEKIKFCATSHHLCVPVEPLRKVNEFYLPGVAQVTRQLSELEGGLTQASLNTVIAHSSDAYTVSAVLSNGQENKSLITRFLTFLKEATTMFRDLFKSQLKQFESEALQSRSPSFGDKANRIKIEQSLQRKAATASSSLAFCQRFMDRTPTDPYHNRAIVAYEPKNSM